MTNKKDPLLVTIREKQTVEQALEEKKLEKDLKLIGIDVSFKYYAAPWKYEQYKIYNKDWWIQREDFILWRYISYMTRGFQIEECRSRISEFLKWNKRKLTYWLNWGQYVSACLWICRKRSIIRWLYLKQRKYVSQFSKEYCWQYHMNSLLRQ